MTFQAPQNPNAARVKAGQAAEVQTRRHLDERFARSADHAFLHDLRLDAGDGDIVQIDHLVLNRFAEAWVVETKSAVGGFAIDRRGQWTRGDRGSVVPISSPVRQAERQASAIGRLDYDRKLPLPQRVRLLGGLDVRALVVVADRTLVSFPDTPPEAVTLELGRIVRGDEIGERMWLDWQYPVQCEGDEEQKNWARSFLAPLRLISQRQLAELRDAVRALALPAAGRCATCDRTTTQGEQDYCRSYSERFSGGIHCYACQQTLRCASRVTEQARPC